MSYSSLARRWRPRTFSEVVGQEAIVQTLQNALLLQRIHPAYLFAGPRGVGKTTLARIFSKGLNCHKYEHPTPEPCGFDCDSCIEITESRSIDVMEFDAASNTQVEKIRERIIEKIDIRPARDRFRVFIIDEVHMLSTSSFNALLKTLEEPPDRVVFIMATTEIHRLPATILSRCQKFHFRLVQPKKIFDRLKQIAIEEKIQIEDEALWEIVRAGEGSIRDSLSAFDQVVSLSAENFESPKSPEIEKQEASFTRSIALEDVQVILGKPSSELLKSTVEAIASHQTLRLFEIVAELSQKGYSLNAFSNELMYFIRSLLVVRLEDSGSLLEDSPFSIEELKALSSKFTESELIRIFNQLSKLNLTLRQAKHPRYYLEIGLIRLAEMKRLTPIDRILERIAQIENELKLKNSPSEPLLSDSKSSIGLPPSKPLETTEGHETTESFTEEVKTLTEKIAPQEKKTFEFEPYESQKKHLENCFFPETDKLKIRQLYDNSIGLRTAAGRVEKSASSVSAKTTKTTTKSEKLGENDPKIFSIESENLSVPSLKIQLSAEELEHVKLPVIDDEFEEKLLEIIKPSSGSIPLTTKLETAFRKAKTFLYHNEKSETESDIEVKLIESLSEATKTKKESDVAQSDSEVTSEQMPQDNSEIIPLPENPTQEMLRKWILLHPITRKMLDYMNVRFRRFGRLDSEK